MQTLTRAQVIKEAERLDKSESSIRQIAATTVHFPQMTIEDAYEIQNEWIERKIRRGARVIGHKIGLTSRVMQVAMSIDEPDFGVLLDDMVYSNEGKINANKFLDPRIEVELAFVLSKDLDPGELTIEGVMSATSDIYPALELIAARTFRVHPDTGYTRTVKDTISDNAANAGIILGNTSIPISADIPWIGALLSKNGVVEESGLAGAVLDHPANSIIWLAKKYGQFNRKLKAGQTILSGSFTRPLVVGPGDKISADFREYGKVSCSFI